MSSASIDAGGAIDAYGGGGLDYSALKRAYTTDDAVSMTFSVIEDYYPVGLMAYLSDPNVIDVFAGWGLFRHNSPGNATPIFLIPIIGPTIPDEIPAFEAKTIMFLSDKDCYVRFDGPNRVQHFIPKNTFMTFNRRCTILYVMGAVAGTLQIWMLG